jgi:hypothetical protein
VKLIYDEPHEECHRFTVITRGGIVVGEDKMTLGKTTEDLGVRKVAKKTQAFDAKKERQVFKEVRKKFKGDQGYSSKT